jgi:hypothetical protein
MDNTNNCWVSQHYHITSWSSYASNFTLRGNCGNGEFGSDTWTPFYPLPTEYPGCSFPNY